MNVFREAYTHIRSFSHAFWVVIAATLMNQIGNMAMVFLVLYLNQHVGVSLVQASIGFAVFSGSMLAAGLLGGNMIDRAGAARIMTIALLLNGVILILFPFFQSYSLIVILCTAWGMTYGLYRPASQTFISQLSTPGMHKVTFSVYRLAVNLGMSIGPAVGGYLATHSYPAIFYANGSANILAVLILLTGLNTIILSKPTQQTAQKPIFSLKWLQQDPALRFFVIGTIPIMMVFLQHEAALPVFLKNDLHLPISFYGLLFTLNTLIIVFFELILNVATMNWPYRANLILGSLFITAGFAGLYFAATRWDIILLTIFWTIGEMILFPAASSYIADIAPEEHRGSYMSLYSSATNAGMLLGPWSGAMVMEKYGAHALWVACGLWGLLSVVMFYYLTEPRHTKSTVTPS